MVKRKALLGLMMLLAFFAGGCVYPPILYIPTPEHSLHGGAYISEEQLTFLQVGKTQRKEVLLQFADPFEIRQNGRFFIYRWQRVHAYSAASLHTRDPGEGVWAGSVERTHYLCLEFAPDGTLKRFTHIYYMSWDKAQEKINKWMTEK